MAVKKWGCVKAWIIGIALGYFLSKLLFERLVPIAGGIQFKQAAALPDATPPIGKIHPFSKMSVAFEGMIKF